MKRTPGPPAPAGRRVGRAARPRRLHGPFLAGLLPVVLAFQEAEPLPGDALEHLDASLRARMELSDPFRDDWETEALQSAITSRLGPLKAWLAGERPTTELEGLVELGGPVSAAPVGLAGDVDVPWVGEGPFGVRLVPARPAPEGTRLGPWLEALRAHLREAPADAAPYVKLKVDGIRREGEREEDVVRTRLRFVYEAGAAAGRYQARSAWHATWSIPEAREGGESRLLALAVEDLEEVRGPAGGLLADASAALFADAPAYERELVPGIDAWRRRLDTRLHVPLLGHPSGLAVGDVDGDGLEDLYACQPGGLPNRLFLGTPGGGLRDATEGSGADVLDFTRSALILDLDGDGDRDLVVAALPEVLLLENVGTPEDVEGAVRFRLAGRLPGPDATSLAAADADLDGDLDLYVCAYVSPYEGHDFPLPYHDANNGLPNTFFLNEGEFTFRDATVESGLDANNSRFSFAAAWEDFDLDGDPDLYVANDFGRNNLYRNDGGTFVDVAAAAGVEDVSAGMGVTWADANGDGLPDLYVSNMDSAAGKRVTYQRSFHPDAPAETVDLYRRHARGNSLFLNEGDGSFEDATPTSGAVEGLWAWGGLFCDLQNDGLPDLLVPNGFLTQARTDDL